MTTKDYSITLQDNTGRSVTLYINGDSIDEQVASGASLAAATEGAEGNAFGNAIDRNEIGADAWIV